MNLQRITHPENPESYATHLQENYIMGVVPAIITSVDDPIKSGRVQCMCNLIDQSNILPNGDDGWIPTLELFTVPEGKGGSHQPLKAGSLVLLAAVLGKPNNWVCLGCLPNNIDKPSPLLDRSNGTHGFVTEGSVYHINNEVDNSQVISYPHGVKKTITGNGDTISETEKGRQVIRKDGTILSESPQASFSLSPEGDVIHQNAAGAIAKLSNNGEVNIKNSSQAELKLSPSVVTLSGSSSILAQGLQTLKKAFGGNLADGAQHLLDLKSIISNPASFLHLDTAIGDLSSIMQKLEGGIAQTYKDGMKSLSDLSVLPTKTFEDAIAQPVKFALDNNLGDITQIIQSGIKEISDPSSLSTHIINSLPQEWQESAPDLTAVISGLRHNPDMLLESVLQKVVPGGVDSSLVRVGLYQSLAPLQKISSEYFSQVSGLSLFEGVTENSYETDFQNKLLGRLIQILEEQLPAPIAGQISSPHTLIDILTNPEAALPSLVATLQQSSLSAGKDHLSQASSLVDLIKPISDLLKVIDTGNLDQVAPALTTLNQIKPGLTSFVQVEPALTTSNQAKPALTISNQTQPISVQDLLPKLFKPLTDELQPMLKEGASQVGSILNTVNSLTKGALLKLESYSATLQASNLLPTGKLKVDATGGYLQAASGIHEVFASLAGAGIKTPFGHFSLGGSGGGFLTKGLMALRVFQDVGKSAGLLLHPQNGVSLSSFPDGGYVAGSHGHDDWIGPSAEVTVDEGTVKIISHGNPYAGIIVNESGTYINGLLMYDYVYAIRQDFTAFQTQVQNNPQVFPTSATLWADEATSILGDFVPQANATQRYGYVGTFSSPVIGAQIQQSFFLKEGSYTATFLISTTPDSGIATVLVNNVIAGSFDAYSATTMVNVSMKVAIAVTKAGTQKIVLKMTNKNATASNYNLSLTKVAIA